MGAVIGDEPEHMWGCEILKVDAASWLQASDHVAIPQLPLFVLHGVTFLLVHSL